MSVKSFIKASFLLFFLVPFLTYVQAEEFGIICCFLIYFFARHNDNTSTDSPSARTTSGPAANNSASNNGNCCYSCATNGLNPATRSPHHACGINGSCTSASPSSGSPPHSTKPSAVSSTSASSGEFKHDCDCSRTTNPDGVTPTAFSTGTASTPNTGIFTAEEE
jgi:hypothetical protein